MGMGGRSRFRVGMTLVAAAATLLVGCGPRTGPGTHLPVPEPTAPPVEHTGNPGPTTGTSSSSVPSASRSVTTGPPPGTGSALRLGEPDNAQTVTVRRGTRLVLVLHNTYWVITGSSNPAVVVSTAVQTHTPDPPGSCLPGIGCGSVSEPFSTRSLGSATLTAHRDSCGEAMPCQAAQSRYVVTVVVTG